jgi:tetratricopeptide (TPR) repeat protein
MRTSFFRVRRFRLNIKYSKQKQEMRDDPVLDALFKAKTFLLHNVNTLIGIAVVMAFAVGFFFFYDRMHQSTLTKSEEAFGKAMIEYTNRNIEKAVEQFRIVADNHRSTPQGIMSAHMLGSIFLSMGRYDDAIKWFEVASVAKKELGFVGGSALEGLAGCYEAKGDIAKTLEYLEKALADDRVAYRHCAIRWKMALLYQKSRNLTRAIALCREILADSTATDLQPKATNLIAAMEANSG